MAGLRHSLLLIFLALAAVGLHAAWIGWARPPALEFPRAAEPGAGLKFLPVPAGRSRLLPAIWSPTFPSTDPEGRHDALALGPPLDHPIATATLLPPPSIAPAMPPQPSGGSPLRNYLAEPLPAPPVVGVPADAPGTGVLWRVEPEARQDALAPLPPPPPPAAGETVRLTLEIADREVKRVLLAVPAASQETNDALVRWAYRQEPVVERAQLDIVVWEAGP